MAINTRLQQNFLLLYEKQASCKKFLSTCSSGFPVILDNILLILIFSDIISLICSPISVTYKNMQGKPINQCHCSLHTRVRKIAQCALEAYLFDMDQKQNQVSSIAKQRIGLEHHAAYFSLLIYP